MGDVIRVVPGSRIPVDGVICSGSSYVDESMLTGETMPASKRTGDSVSSGSLNSTGTILVKAIHVGAGKQY